MGQIEDKGVVKKNIPPKALKLERKKKEDLFVILREILYSFWESFQIYV